MLHIQKEVKRQLENRDMTLNKEKKFNKKKFK